MLKYTDTEVTFAEVPGHITLCINISNCPCKCNECHSSYLAEDIGEPLDEQALDTLIKGNKGITCIAFMGGDAEPEEINRLVIYVKAHYSIKTAWYSGRDFIHPSVKVSFLDFVKIGPYRKECGPLNKDTTNQIFYKVVHLSSGKDKLYDITWKFWYDKSNRT